MSTPTPPRRRLPVTAGVTAGVAAGVAVGVTLALGLSGCGATGGTATPAALEGSGHSGESGASAALSGTVTVLAAASLTESFDALVADFEAAHPGVTIRTSYGSSATLVQQADNGAPADVLALAGEAAAEPLDQSLVKGSRLFASNALEIATPPDNPAGITSIDDLARPTAKVVLCADTVPCGKAAAATFAKARVVPHVVSREVDVKATLSKVRLGEADAAVVYHSDVVAAKDAVKGIEIEPQYNTSLRYPLITLSDDAATTAFAAYVLSAEGLATVQSFGFGAP